MYPNTSSIASTSMFQGKINVWVKSCRRLVRAMQMCWLLSDPPDGNGAVQRSQSRARLWPAFRHHLRKKKATSSFFIPSRGGHLPSPSQKSRAWAPCRSEETVKSKLGTDWDTGGFPWETREGKPERTAIMGQLWSNPVPSWRREHWLFIFFTRSQYLGTPWPRVRHNLHVLSNKEQK